MTRKIYAALLAAFVLVPGGLHAQQRDTAQLRRDAQAKLGQNISQKEILERLRASGMSRQDVREKLRQMGYDPSLADAYFDAIEGRTKEPTGQASSQLIDAMQRMGIAARRTVLDSIALPTDSMRLLMGGDADSVAMSRPDTGSVVFGRSMFNRGNAQFVPVMNGPVDPDYRLGPGDELELVVTGDVELAYPLTISREGFIVIPDVGQVGASGLTLRQLQDRLYDRLGRVYSGISRGSDATTFFQISMSRLRPSQVYVIGDVERPSAYLVSGLSTVFDALYQAGGPTDYGTFRRIEVRRSNRVITTVDLYDYLLRGDRRGDIRLEQGDAIFVPPAETQVRIEGAVRRPAIYEMLPGETVRDLLRFAGGPRGDAVLRRVQIDRILSPAEQRATGTDRGLIDVNVEDLLSASPRTVTTQAGEPVALRDRDVVQVFTVSRERRNRIVLTGEVRRPGTYQWQPGMTLQQLLDRAEGLERAAFRPRAHVFRLNEALGNREMIQVPLDGAPGAASPAQVQLADLDSVVVYSQPDMQPQDMVVIHGYVKNPGAYPLARGMTVKDLILAAGSFMRGADVAEAQVARRPSMASRSDTTAIVTRVPLAAPGDARTTEEMSLPDSKYWNPAATEFALRDGDQIFIRRAVGFEEVHGVQVYGEVMSPGGYVLQSRTERLLDILAQAGGLTPEAYGPGLRLVRAGQLVATDLPLARRDPESRYNVTLQPGDSLFIPRYDATVLVTGAVAFVSRVLYEPGKDLQHYIDRAGGYGDNADKGRVSVEYQDGERRVVKKRVLYTQTPPIRPGTIINVPAKRPEDLRPFNWDQFLTKLLAALSAAATVYVATK